MFFGVDDLLFLGINQRYLTVKLDTVRTDEDLLGGERSDAADWMHVQLSDFHCFLFFERDRLSDCLI